MINHTPIERLGQFWAKRDDKFSVAGIKGGKARTCWALAQGAKGLVTAGSRSSPQCNIVAHMAVALGIPCRLHTPQGELGPELCEAAAQPGAEVVQHRAGYNNVIISRARDDAAKRGWRLIPFGMESPEAVKQTASQVVGLPTGVKRIVIAVGSGMSLSGVLHGLLTQGLNIPVLGVVVGADPTKRLDTYAPHWRNQCKLVPSGFKYDQRAPTDWHGTTLDPIYEAKCVQHLQPGDLLWVIGIRNAA